MPKLTLPTTQDGSWNIDYKADRGPALVDGFNIDLHSYNTKVGISGKLLPWTTTADVSTIKTITQFLVSNFNNNTNTLYYVAAAAEIYLLAKASFSNFALDALTSSPTGLSDADAIVHGKCSDGVTDQLVVSDITNVGTQGDLARFSRDVSTTTWTLNWWTSTLAQNPMDPSVPIILKVFGNAPELFVLNGSKLHSVNTPTAPTGADVTANRLVFKTGYVGNWMQVTSEKIYIGLKDKKSDHYPSLIEEYDPFSEQVREIVIEEGATIGKVQDNTLYIVDSKGHLRQYDGNRFPTIANFPTAYINGASLNLPHRNGIAATESRLHFLMTTPNIINIFGGLWTYDFETKQLYHTSSMGLSKSTGDNYGTPDPLETGALFSQEYTFFFAGGKVARTIASGTPNNTEAGIWSMTQTGPGASFTDARAWFTTEKIFSPDIQSVFRNILTKYTPALLRIGLQTGSITVKFRTADKTKGVGSVSLGTWNSATVFYVSNTVGANMRVGDEIFITQGVGSGMLFNISNIQKDLPSGGTTTVTLSESFPNGITPAGDLFFIMSNFNQISPMITDNTKRSAILDVPDSVNPLDYTGAADLASVMINPAEWCQFKLEMRGSFFVEQLQLGIQRSLMVEPDNQSSSEYAPVV